MSEKLLIVQLKRNMKPINVQKDHFYRFFPSNWGILKPADLILPQSAGSADLISNKQHIDGSFHVGFGHGAYEGN